MPLRPCLDCGELSSHSRCPKHQRAQERRRDQRRGTRQQRGLDAEYDRNRAHLLANTYVCAVCGLPGSATDPLTAGHIISRAQGGTNHLSNLRAEHASYNYSQGRGCRGTGQGGG